MPRPRGPMEKKPLKETIHSVSRAVKILFKHYPAQMALEVFLLLFSSAASAIPSVFTEKILTVVEKYFVKGVAVEWTEPLKEILPLVGLLVGIYALSVVAIIISSQMMATITQDFMHYMRVNLFNKMQNLPIRYFDSRKTGDIMSVYTNDIDTLRELVSGTLPMMIQAGAVVLVIFAIMIYYSVWLTLAVLVGVALMFIISAKVGGGSAKYFIKNQKAVGRLEGFVQEIMNGQKVVKVFNHEEIAKKDFEGINEQLNQDGFKAHAYANILGPIINNIGNILYVALALIGGVFIVLNVPNFSLSGGAFTVAVLIPFLNMSKQFASNINNLSQQLNSIVMAAAGAGRVWEMMDSEPETDEGYVTLVNVKEENGKLVETTEHTKQWAWRHEHKAGGVDLVPLQGDVQLTDVDFSYRPEHQILYDVTVSAKPGQKIAFVGATGAGKTTITNLINRFYDIEDGKIRYDGININKIKKSDLRRSLGLVLQDTNLFSGTVMDNIRYGRLDATDEECIEAAKLAGADDFITRLPLGYNTELNNNGSNISQGQRQLIAIARAAVADPPVMILDEATSSIDTRTEAIVQKGMDKLMEGRTVFVIAHRLSTVMNSDVIMVLDHGHIIEKGNHEELIDKKGVYYQLYTGAFELE